MAEYIDIDAQVVVTDTRGRERETTVRHILEMNKGVYTAADVQPVVLAYWKSVPHKRARVCSRCEADEPYKFADDDANVYSFCPNCGADMREAEDEKA